MGATQGIVLFGVLLALTTAGCSDNGGSDHASSGQTSGSASSASSAPTTGAVDTAAVLDGTSYASTQVTGHDLVEGTVVTLAFDAGGLTVSAGCNTMFGAYAVDGGILQWTGHPASTMKACSDDLMAQDQWLTQLFTDGAAVTTDGSDLTLTSGEVTIELSAKTATTPGSTAS
jgi:heat shock protein HslJ